MLVLALSFLTVLPSFDPLLIEPTRSRSKGHVNAHYFRSAQSRTLIAIFNRLFSTEMIATMAESTNQYAELKIKKSMSGMERH